MVCVLCRIPLRDRFVSRTAIGGSLHHKRRLVDPSTSDSSLSRPRAMSPKQRPLPLVPESRPQPPVVPVALRNLRLPVQLPKQLPKVSAALRPVAPPRLRRWSWFSVFLHLSCLARGGVGSSGFFRLMLPPLHRLEQMMAAHVSGISMEPWWSTPAGISGRAPSASSRG